MKRVPPLDWRYRTVTTLTKDWKSPFTGLLHKAGASVSVSTFIRHGDRELQIGDPSGPALFLNHSWHCYRRALKSHPLLRGGKTKDPAASSKGAYDYLEAIMAAIVFSHTAIEAFANEEIPDQYQHALLRRSGIYVVLGRLGIERQIDLSEKLSTILPQVKKVQTPKGSKTWEDFITLKRMRDRIVHMKASDRATSKEWERFPDTIWARLLAPQQPNYPLAARTMIAHFVDPAVTHWLRCCPIE